LEEIIVSKEKLDLDAETISFLQSRVYITYPYAKLASERLTLLNKGMTRLSSNREKKYFKIVESYLSEFDKSLKCKSRANIGKANSSPNRHYDL
jgi:hypothetical protein